LIGFLFKSGRRARLESGEAIPSEFFYGFVELARGAAPVALVEESELGLDQRHSRALAAISHVTARLTGLHLGVLLRLLGAAPRAILARHQVLVATTTSLGVALMLMRRLGLCPARLVVLAMGLIDPTRFSFRLIFLRRIVGDSVLATLSRSEAVELRGVIPQATIRDFVFGVDDGYWRPPQETSSAGVLSIGNDPFRDYDTLIASWTQALPHLTIVTSRQLGRLPANVTHRVGDWRSQILSDSEIRLLFQRAAFVVIPLHNTLQPSGQSACLQAMACGKTVILSAIDGLWDRDLMRDGVTCILVPPGDVRALREAVAALADDPQRAARIGAAARRVVETRLNTRAMAESMRNILDQACEAIP
jgi:glycosyltransferase involved in cell wall biosynthesis